MKKILICNHGKDKIKNILGLIAVWALYLTFLPQMINANNFIYSIGQIHAFDKTLFVSNVFMIDGGISPRYILDAVFAFFMRLNGGNWENVAVPFIHISVLVLSVATVTLAYRLSEKYCIIFSIIIALFFGLNVSSSVAGFDTFNQATIGMGMGYSLSILGIAFVIGKDKNFNAAWISVAMAVMAHVHEGIYGFATVFIFLIIEILNEKQFSFKRNWCILIFFVVGLAVVVPNMRTDPLMISKEEFVSIYAVYRHPHHLIPSSWDKMEILRSLMVIIYPAVLRIEYLYFEKKVELKKFFSEVSVFVFAWIGVIVVMYIGTERLNMVSVTTLFFSKFFKYVAVISLVWYIKIIRDYLKTHRYLLVFLILGFATFEGDFSSYAPAVLLCIVAYSYYCHKNNAKEYYKKDYLYAGILGGAYLSLLAFSSISSVKLELKIDACIIAMIFLIIMLWKYYGKKYYKIVAYSLTVMLLVLSMYGHFYQYYDGKIEIVTPTDVLLASSGNDIYQLANNFRNQTETTVEFLANPTDESSVGWLQTISRRNCYVNSHIIPSSKAMVKEWYERYQLTTALFDKEASEIVTIMERASIAYLLVDKENYEKIEASGFFNVFTTCDGDSYRIYALNKGQM